MICVTKGTFKCINSTLCFLYWQQIQAHATVRTLPSLEIYMHVQNNTGNVLQENKCVQIPTLWGKTWRMSRGTKIKYMR